LEAFELPALQDNEILADVTTNSICMSSHKATIQGAAHKRVPDNVAENPIIMGHEFSGTILEVGKACAGKFQAGQKYSIQPAIVYPGREYDAPGYSFPWIGGQASKIIIPKEVLEPDCLLPYGGAGFFKASLSEPMSCIIGAFHAQYHFKTGEYDYKMGIIEGGAMAILAGAGPMGLGAIDYTLHGPRRPRLLVVTDVDQARLDRAAGIITVEEARRCGVELRYVNTASGNPVDDMKALNQGQGYDDVFVFAPVAPLIEQASAIMGLNGCLNFFAGPSDPDFKASMNFYDIHYSGHHIVGTSGGNTDDMREALALMAEDVIDPSVLVTHVGGIDSAAQTILELPNVPGGKKLIYTQKSMPLTAIDDFAELGKEEPFYRELGEITAQTNNLWSLEAEAYVLEHAKDCTGE
jgi:threonine dehydrogenase-like Zn-dependent dehydrogenase